VRCGDRPMAGVAGTFGDATRDGRAADGCVVGGGRVGPRPATLARSGRDREGFPVIDQGRGRRPIRRRGPGAVAVDDAAPASRPVGEGRPPGVVAARAGRVRCRAVVAISDLDGRIGGPEISHLGKLRRTDSGRGKGRGRGRRRGSPGPDGETGGSRPGRPAPAGSTGRGSCPTRDRSLREGGQSDSFPHGTRLLAPRSTAGSSRGGLTAGRRRRPPGDRAPPRRGCRRSAGAQAGGSFPVASAARHRSTRLATGARLRRGPVPATGRGRRHDGPGPSPDDDASRRRV
jgi:hypothetical protein